MAHDLATANDMAYVGETPWHGLGNQLPKNQPIEVWQKSAGMDFEIKQTDVLFNAANGDGNLLNLRSNPDATVLYRSDNNEALSVVSKRYKVVQPKDVLGFYRDLVSVGGFELETAGVLKGGKKLWALAKTGQETMLAGGDKVNAYLLLATSCDGSLTDGSNLVLSPVCKFGLTGSKVKAEQLKNLLLSLSNCLIEAVQEHSKSNPEQIQKAKNNLEHAMIRFKTIFRVLDNDKIRPVAEIAVNHFDELKEQLDYGINAGEIFEEANLIYQLSDNFIEAMHEREEINLDLATPNDQDSELVRCLKALLLYLEDHREQQNFDHKVNSFMNNR